ncbi:hypothetical protein Btru_041300 [Bulinus truncatus]|nr:hypothetical protein Btru_041300 [Bulinus truncatus]
MVYQLLMLDLRYEVILSAIDVNNSAIDFLIQDIHRINSAIVVNNLSFEVIISTIDVINLSFDVIISTIDVINLSFDVISSTIDVINLSSNVIISTIDITNLSFEVIISTIYVINLSFDVIISTIDVINLFFDVIISNIDVINSAINVMISAIGVIYSVIYVILLTIHDIISKDGVGQAMGFTPLYLIVFSLHVGFVSCSMKSLSQLSLNGYWTFRWGKTHLTRRRSNVCHVIVDPMFLVKSLYQAGDFMTEDGQLIELKWRRRGARVGVTWLKD